MANRFRVTLNIAVLFGEEEDGRFIADFPETPGVMAYGRTRQEALDNVMAVLLDTMADQTEHGEIPVGVFGAIGTAAQVAPALFAFIANQLRRGKWSVKMPPLHRVRKDEPESSHVEKLHLVSV